MKGRHWGWGLFFLCAAALIIFTQLGYIVNISAWRIILSVFLGAVVLQSLFHLEFFGVFVPLAVIGILFAEPLGIQALVPWSLLGAAVCLSIGFYILFRASVKRRWQSHHYGQVRYHNGNSTPKDEKQAQEPREQQEPRGQDETKSDYAYKHGDYKQTRETISDDAIECEITFGSGVKYLHSESLRSANFTCAFGAMKVYFDQARLSPNGADVNVECSFSSMELFIPRKWHVVDTITPTLGRVKTHPHTPEDAEPTLTLRGNVQFGSVEIIYI